MSFADVVHVRHYLEPFPYKDNTQVQWFYDDGAKTFVNDLWPERQRKMSFGKNGSTHGRVGSWIEWISGPFSTVACWYLSFRSDKISAEFNVGDMVKVTNA